MIIYDYKDVQGTERNRRRGMTSEQTDLLRTGTAITANWTRPDRTGQGVERNGPALCGTAAYLDWTGMERTGPDQTVPNRTRPDWAEPTRSAAVWRGMGELYLADWDQTGPGWTGLDQNGLDQTGPDQMRYGTEQNCCVPRERRCRSPDRLPQRTR